jgi:hypothetical protein
LNELTFAQVEAMLGSIRRRYQKQNEALEKSAKDGPAQNAGVFDEKKLDPTALAIFGIDVHK